MATTRWVCVDCGHEVYAPTRPGPMRWSDGHICHFREDADVLKPDWVVSKFGNRIVGSGNPMVKAIKAHDPGEKLAFGFKFGDDVSARLDDGSVEGGMLVHYADDHFYVDIDGAGWTEVYKTKIKERY